jgi:CheY-like chemotaxis protein
VSAKKSSSTILLLENDDDDAFFFRRALVALDADSNLRIVPSVTQAREYIEGKGAFQDRQYFPLPDLIVSDLKMPGQTGIEFLQWLNTHTEYRQIPFVMLSGSALPEDRDAALRAGARAFFTKTGNFGQNKEQTREILTFIGAPVPLEPVTSADTSFSLAK